MDCPNWITSQLNCFRVDVDRRNADEFVEMARVTLPYVKFVMRSWADNGQGPLMSQFAQEVCARANKHLNETPLINTATELKRVIANFEHVGRLAVYCTAAA